MRSVSTASEPSGDPGELDEYTVLELADKRYRKVRRELILAALRLTAHWPAAIVTLIVAVVLSKRLVGNSHTFPEAIGASATAFLTAEVFLLGFALNSWHGDYRRVIDGVTELHQSMVDEFCFSGATRKPLHLFPDAMRLLDSERATAISTLRQTSLSSLKESLTSLQWAYLAQQGTGSTGGIAQELVIAESIVPGLASDRQTAREKSIRRLRNARLAAEGRFSAAFWLAVGVAVLCVLGTGYAGWWPRPNFNDPSVWRAISLCLAAVGVYAASDGVRRRLRESAEGELGNEQLKLLLDFKLMQDIPNEVPSADQYRAVEKKNRLTREAIDRRRKVANPKRKKQLDTLYVELVILLQPANWWWSRQGRKRVAHDSSIEASWAPVAFRQAAYHLWLGLTLPSPEYTVAQLQIAANFLSPFIRLRDDSTEWWTDIEDPAIGLLRATIAQQLGQTAAANQLDKVTAPWISNIKGTPAHFELGKIMKSWMLPPSAANEFQDTT
jgi:hypothetical protein